jgi:hypothetical protein
MAGNQLPRASNNIKTNLLFENRKFYKDDVFPKYGPRPIDFWYEKPYYGKVDIYGAPVYILEEFLGQLSGTDAYAMNFVAAAFNDFKKFVLAASAAKKTKIVDFLGGTLNPTSAWTSIHKLYHRHFTEGIYNTFINTYIPTKRNFKVKNFDTFVLLFIDYCDAVKNDIPITKTAYLTSPLCPSSISGLTIDLTKASDADDYGKYKRFISNPGFNEYRKIAANFGFFIDKNAPWRLVSNFAANITKEYMQTFGTSIKHNAVFNDRYTRCSIYDYLSLKTYLFQSYRSFLDTSPNVVTTKVKTQCSPGQTGPLNKSYVTQQVLTPRTHISDNFYEFRKMYPDSFFLRVYALVRLIESKQIMNMNRTSFDQIIERTLNLNKYVSTTAAVHYIDSVFKQTRIYEPERKLDPTPFQLSYFPASQLSGLSFLGEGDILSKLGQIETIIDNSSAVML